jgi:hypothetical protein
MTDWLGTETEQSLRMERYNTGDVVRISPDLAARLFTPTWIVRLRRFPPTRWLGRRLEFRWWKRMSAKCEGPSE